MKCIIDAKEILNKIKQYNEDLVFVVNSDDISYRNDVEVNDVNFGYKYTEIGRSLHAFISDDCEVLIQKRSEDVSEGFIEFLFKLQEVIKRYKDTKSSYDGLFKILEHTWYNRIDDDDNEVNEIIDIDERCKSNDLF